MNIRRSLPALLAGAVCLVALAASAAGQLPAHVRGWSARLEGGLDFTLDPQGRAWILTRDAFVRLDDQGEVAERIPFTWPADFKRDSELQKIFLAVGDDFLVGPYRFDRRGQPVTVYPFLPLWRLAPRPDGTVVHASAKGLDIHDRKGKLVRHADTEPMRPTAVVVDRRGRILVAERERIRIFDRRGRHLRTVDVPVEPPRLGGGIENLALDGAGNVYATVFAGSTLVVVLDPELQYLGIVPFGWSWIPRFLAVDRQGRLYGMHGPPWTHVLQQSVPESGSAGKRVPRETVLNIPELPPQTLPAVGIPVQATLTDSPAWPFRLHVSTRPLRAVAADPKIPGRLWIGGDAGLLRYDTGTGDWQRWTLADGLPDNEVRALASDGRRVYLVLARGAAVFDPETGRFRTLDVQGEGLTHMAGLRVEQDPGHPGILWWIAEQGVLRHNVAAESWSYFRNPGNSTLIDGALSGNGRIFVASSEEVWELRPTEREWRRVTNAGVLDLATPERREPTRPSPITAVSADPEGRTLWVAADRAGLLRVDTGSGRVDWPEETRREICGSQRVLRQGSRLLAFGFTCLTEIGPAECCQIDRHRVREIRAALGDLRQPDLLWLATSQGLLSFRIGDGHLALHSPPWTEPDGVRMSRLLPVEGRLWVAPMNGGVSVLEPATGQWKVLPGLFNIPDLHRSAANGHLLVLRPIPQGGGRELAWIDPKTTEQVLLPVPTASLYIFNDLHHDEQGLWVLGRLGDRRTQSLALLEPGGATRIVCEGSFGSGPDALVPDAAPSHLLAVTGKGELVRIQTKTGEMETLRSGVQKIRPAGGRYVWIEGRPNARLDLQTRAVAVLDIEGQFFPDPRNPDHGWLLREDVVALYDVVRGGRLAEVTLPAHEEYEDVTVFRDRLWVGSHIGLLEIALDKLPGK